MDKIEEFQTECADRIKRYGSDKTIKKVVKSISE